MGCCSCLRNGNLKRQSLRSTFIIIRALCVVRIRIH
jgi:hypothetical protein